MICLECRYCKTSFDCYMMKLYSYCDCNIIRLHVPMCFLCFGNKVDEINISFGRVKSLSYNLFWIWLCVT